jgi:hypothetical protein
MVVAAAVTTLALALAASAGAETRVPGQWPFTASSPWNTPLGTGAAYTDPTCDGALQASFDDVNRPWINADNWSFPVYAAAATDPPHTIYKSLNPTSSPEPQGTSQGSYPIPALAKEAGGDDRSMVVQEPNGRYSIETWRTFLYPAWANVGGFARHDMVGGDGWRPLTGFGVHAANASGLGGLIRSWELQAGSVRHALAIAMHPSHMKALAVAPATSIDRNSSEYAGPIPMGQLFAIPQGTSIDSLGLRSEVGRQLATAMQKYGGYLVDKAGNFLFYAEPSAATLVNPARNGSNPAGTPWASDVTRILGATRCVSNNTGPNWGGGGTPLAPPAPPFS